MSAILNIKAQKNYNTSERPPTLCCCSREKVKISANQRQGHGLRIAPKSNNTFEGHIEEHYWQVL